MIALGSTAVETIGYLGAVEAQEQVNRLTDDEQRILARAADRYAYGAAWGADDLLQEALARAFEGKCPKGVPLLAFLIQSMRQTASNFRRRDSRVENGGGNSARPDENVIPADRIAVARQALDALHAEFDDDDEMLLFVYSIAQKKTESEVIADLRIDNTTYNKFRKRFSRAVARLKKEHAK
jgi:DNA-directed RNA polymerase specialized sigma24 family protein